MSSDRPTSTPLGRFLRLGGLIGRVGASVVGSRAADIVRPGSESESRRTENLLDNAMRIVETLGEMKGAAMKVGQMLSLHEGLLPPEVAEVLRLLQKEAPQVPSEVMRWEMEGSLQADVDELFAELEEDAYAAASIGQVHRGRLKDGRPVAVKVQYPLIDEIVKADLKNLRRLLGALFALVSDADFEPVWREVQDRLLEELDYRREADNMRRMARLHASIPEIACADGQPPELRNRWGRVLFEFQLRGLLEHRLLHADPNLANFSFLEDGRVIVYDFGCVKRIPPEIAEGYVAVFRAALEGLEPEIPDVLRSMGVLKLDGSALPRELTAPYFELFSEILRDDPPYVFGENEQLYERLVELGMANWTQATDIRFPRHLVFIDRALSGHLGNLIRLRASGPWRALVRRYCGTR
jgi:predicted unusual protein kinase regulating ubiquinone biosynthesis (AarF/ABC1/UbiB family)